MHYGFNALVTRPQRKTYTGPIDAMLCAKLKVLTVVGNQAIDLRRTLENRPGLLSRVRKNSKHTPTKRSQRPRPY